MQRILVLLSFYLLHYTSGQSNADADGKNVDKLIDEIFTKPNPTTNTDTRNPSGNDFNLQPSPGGSASSNGDCECVPYYLCNNNSIIIDGYGVIDIRIDDGPCDYLSVCCGTTNITVDPITPAPPIDKPKGCGNRNPDGVGFRITGAKDNEAQFAEFPWMVAILNEEAVEGNTQRLLVYKCGGSLIHGQVVVTSAHCVTGPNKQFKVRAGEWDTQTKNELFPHQDRDVKTIIIHPDYYAGSLLNDIAVLILDSPFEITDNVDVICLPKQDMVVENTRCFASGWGKDVFGKEGKYQVILKKIDLPIVQRDTCQEYLRATRLGKHFKLHPSFICAGGEAGKDTCKGDGGSPLICPIPGQPDKYFQAGIVAWGIGCAEENVPGVYANVAMFANWVDEQLAFHEISRSGYKYD